MSCLHEVAHPMHRRTPTAARRDKGFRVSRGAHHTSRTWREFTLCDLCVEDFSTAALKRCGSARRQKGRDKLPYLAPRAGFGNAQVIVALKVQPELRLHSEVRAKP